MIASLGKSSIFGRPPPPARPRPIDFVSAAVASYVISEDTKIKRSSPDCDGLCEGEGRDKCLYCGPATDASTNRPSHDSRGPSMENSEVSQGVSRGSKPRPNSTARPLPDNARTHGPSGDINPFDTHQPPEQPEEGSVFVDRLQQLREFERWKTWEERKLQESFNLFTPKRLSKAVSSY